jgi:DNA-binding NtrC family response regulator
MATLLIVDDDNIIRETLHELLSETHECHTADRAEQALAYLEIESYDTVLTDISMPGLSGREILKRIQEQHPTTPVIVISGNSNTGAAAELIAMGAFAYLTKPFQLTEVEDTVNRAIALRQELLAAAKKENGGADPDETRGTESAESR